MSQEFGNFFQRKPTAAGGHGGHHPAAKPHGLTAHKNPLERKSVFAKVFRWRLPEGQTTEPVTVEIVGTFTRWQKVALTRNSGHDAWQVALHDIPAHRTHHYMLLVDGQPAPDKNNDGYAIPTTPEEQQYQLMTPRGPRVFMLFAQTK